MKHPVITLTEKESRLVAGLMSGTSVDGIDAVLCRVSGHGFATRVEQISFVSLPFSAQVRKEILRMAGGEAVTAPDICRINALLGVLYTEAVDALVKKAGIGRDEIDLIGSHGQTFWHIPEAEPYCGRNVRGTLQLGDVSLLAETFSCLTVSDFRVRDMAAGGQGAPLVPYSEYLLYRSETENIALQNIGGIGNITCLKRGCLPEEVYAFDTGPGNMVIDAATERLTQGAAHYDDGGARAAKGHADASLLSMLMEDPYLKKRPPKSTGREYYGSEYMDRIFSVAAERNIAPDDLIATATRFTAETIAFSVKEYCTPVPDRVIIGGGGSRNLTLLHMIRDALPACEVLTNEEIGFDSDAKEAVAFAIMANEALFAGANNLMSVTGASHPVVMGKIGF
ncbi:MAG: anhydro-N-acetylmuramic acid kinase [Lachnospiraceae bacterium]|nr:anhydro-N-acetylmuramic acid kinase [Lachnospiraceae bacterium]